MAMERLRPADQRGSPRVVAAMADAGWLDDAIPHDAGASLGLQRNPGYYLVLFGVQIKGEWHNFTLELGWGKELLKKVAALQNRAFREIQSP